MTTSPSASRTSARQIFLLVQQYATNIWFQHVSISIIYSKVGVSLLLFYEHHYYPKKVLCCLTGKTVINYGMKWGSPLSDKPRGCSLMFFWLFQMTCVVTLSEKTTIDGCVFCLLCLLEAKSTERKSFGGTV